MPMAIPIAATALTVSSGASVYLGSKQLEASRRSRNAARDLENQRQIQLKSEAAAREAAAEKAAGAGSRVGGGARSFTQALGFGSGNTGAGLGQGTLFGN